MNANYGRSLQQVLKSEGGYTNNSKDPGGATNKGVTQAVYDDWRRNHGLAVRSVKEILPEEVTAIYKRQYWDSVNGDNLPAGVDYAVFDFAVNSGVGRAARFLQEVLGVMQDGHIGPATIAAIHVPTQCIDALCRKRLDFLKSLSTFATFGNGWTSRVISVEILAKDMTS